MTETNEPSSQPGQQSPGAPPYPNAQPSPLYPNPQFGAPPPGYPNPNAQYGSTPYGSAPYGNSPYGNAQHGGYGPYNNGPYGYPLGYYGQPPGTNGMAIASLVLGICGFLCVTPFVGLSLGLAALSRIKRTGQPGKGMAIAGIILSSAWIALMILAIVTGNFHFDIGNGSNPGPSSGQTQGPNGTSA